MAAPLPEANGDLSCRVRPVGGLRSAVRIKHEITINMLWVRAKQLKETGPACCQAEVPDGELSLHDLFLTQGCLRHTVAGKDLENHRSAYKGEVAD